MSNLTFVVHDEPTPVEKYSMAYAKFVTVYWYGHEFLEIVRYGEDPSEDEEDEKEKSEPSKVTYENRWYIHTVNQHFNWRAETCLSLEEALKACLKAEEAADQLRLDLDRMFHSPRPIDEATHKPLTP